MADFVAVIRRTVDGLSDNVPEMRTRVYDKARSAVRRQLESMKPQPSEDMINRQMAKLELAITEVESENAEAIPAIDQPDADAGSAVTPEQPPIGERDAVPLHESSQDEPGSAPIDDAAPAEQPVLVEQPVPAEAPALVEDPGFSEDASLPVDAPVYRDEPAPPDTLVHAPDDLYEDHAVVAAARAPDLLADGHADNWRPLDTPVWVPPPRQDEPRYTDGAADDDLHSDPIWQPVEPVAVADASAGEIEPAPAVEAAQVTRSLYDEGHDERDEAASPHAPVPVWERLNAELADEPAPVAASEWDLPEWNTSHPSATPAATDWPDPEQHVSDAEEAVEIAAERVAELAREAEADPTTVATDPTHSWSWEEGDPFAQREVEQHTTEARTEAPALTDWSWPVEKPVVAASTVQAPPADVWNEIEDLLDREGAATAAAAATRIGEPAASDEMAAPARPISYRAEPKRSAFTPKLIGLTAVFLLALGGGGYAYWQNQNSINSWVSGMIASIDTPDPTSIPATTTTDTATPPVATESQPTAETATAPNTEVAALDADASTKFTQRLQADGSEIDPGPAVIAAGESPQEEGKSVAAQTEAGTPQDGAAVETAPGTTTPGTAVPGTATADQAQAVVPIPDVDPVEPAVQPVPAGAQKMFLYEERLGQSAPTAIEGNVAWSVKEESPGGDAKPEPVIQAQISVPERGLTALVTIKRNADASLPASHVIEFVFSLPDNFEGGSIDSVQRVSMKRNEQDRGDALIAVPAKITEDFHMIALNDFAEAVTANTELLRSRSWIDIPLTYRNGRRALLTLEKGSTGTDAFNKAMQAWSLTATASPAATGQ